MINITGAAEGRIAPIIAKIIKEKKGQSLIVVSTLNKAKRLATDLSFFVSKKIYVLPADENMFIEYEAKSNDELLRRMSILRALAKGEDCIVIAPVTGAIRKLPPKNIFEKNILEVKQDGEVLINDIKEKLSILGYERVDIVETRGEYSIRGEIIDVFTPEADNPYRIELFDTEIESIKSFDVETQRSIERLKNISIFPCIQIIRDEEIFAKAKEKIKKAYDRQINKIRKSYDKKDEVTESENEILNNLIDRRGQLIEYSENMINIQYMEKFLNYFHEENMYLWEYMENPDIFIDDPSRILETLDVYEKERKEEIAQLLMVGRAIAEDFKAVSSEDDYFKLYNKDGYIFTPFVSQIKKAPFLSELININSRQTPNFNGHLDILKTELENYIENDYQVILVCSNEQRIKNIKEFLMQETVSSKVSIVKGTLTAGMDFPDEKTCYIWEGEIFGSSERTKRRKKKTQGNQIKTFADVKEGDYVVHENHGIGKFLGIEQLIVQGIKKDYLKIKYAGEDSLYVPVDQLSMLQRYVGGEGVKPRLNKLSNNEWKQVKAKARAAIDDMAEDIIRISAIRMNEKGYAFSKDTVWQSEFEDSFPYTETDDQLRAIEEIKTDMEHEAPMERLLCGDVGFGKTEVAARAMFKCVADGKQAAILVPTTLLANQHYYTLKERFEKFPFKVEMFSRFKTKKEQTEIIKKVEKGSVDLVIGTHRLLSKDVMFKDLGLLVIDEEQRFGVKHKEKIKLIKENVDVLTLSATPIPRTLHMSLSGIKGMSTLDEPPENRNPVQTYVMHEDNLVIREAIEKEISRGGQVYILHNRVDSIERITNEIAELVPDVNVTFAHGKMRENQLEDKILEFSNGEYDVLVSTTIIESGMDIPNVNTMIILDADRFGLAQLYQLRGRVGRSNRMAYAYLMHKKEKHLTEIAEKRLKAIKDFTEFGSGFKIAMRDLELRGAGNLLGSEQSGHMLNIGYELYAKMLNEAVEKIKGNNVITQVEETVINLPILAIIPDSYIENDVLRLQMYKKIAFVSNDEDEMEIVDEFYDRFGDIPKETLNLIKTAKIRTMSGKLGVQEINKQGYKLILKLNPDIKVNQEVLSRLSEEYGGEMLVNAGSEPFIRLTINKMDPIMELEKFLNLSLNDI